MLNILMRTLKNIFCRIILFLTNRQLHACHSYVSPTHTIGVKQHDRFTHCKINLTWTSRFVPECGAEEIFQEGLESSKQMVMRL